MTSCGQCGTSDKAEVRTRRHKLGPLWGGQGGGGDFDQENTPATNAPLPGDVVSRDTKQK